MNRPSWILRCTLGLWLFGVAWTSVSAQTLFDQRRLLYPFREPDSRGLNWAPQPPKRLPTEATNSNSRGMSYGAIVYSSVTVQGRTTLQQGASFAANAKAIDWPRSPQEAPFIEARIIG